MTNLTLVATLLSQGRPTSTSLPWPVASNPAVGLSVSPRLTLTIGGQDTTHA